MNWTVKAKKALTKSDQFIAIMFYYYLRTQQCVDSAMLYAKG